MKNVKVLLVLMICIFSLVKIQYAEGRFVENNFSNKIDFYENCLNNEVTEQCFEDGGGDCCEQACRDRKQCEESGQGRCWGKFINDLEACVDQPE